jgi:hypothetical protein
LRFHQCRTLDGNLELRIAFVDQEHAIVNGRREIQQMAVTLGCRRRSTQHETQVAARMATGSRREHEKIKGDQVQRHAAHAPPEAQRYVGHQTQHPRAAALLFGNPLGRVRREACFLSNAHRTMLTGWPRADRW